MSEATPQAAPKKRDRTHWLYLAVIVAVVAGILVGWLAPGFGVAVAPLGSMFINLIKMMIAPVIFCTIVLGIGSIRTAATVGKVGGLTIGYFLIMSTAALGIGLVVGNLVQPGTGLNIASSAKAGQDLAKTAHSAGGTWDFIQSIVPTSLLSSLTAGSVLQALFVALLVGFAVQAMGKAGEPVIRAVSTIQKLVFRILSMVLWLAPIGAFGAIANVVGKTGLDAVVKLATLMLAFYLTCLVFVFGLLGVLIWAVSRVSILKLCRYLAREYLLIVATSSSEPALPRLIAKMEHLGIERTTVGVVVPTGYSFNLDGTAIYLTMASLFIADAMGKPLNLGEQVGLLLFMIVASKGAAGVTGAGLATLAGGLQSHRPELLDGVGLIVGIDRFMSEARALTNFSGNAVATVLIGTWTKTIDTDRVREVLDRKLPFDEKTMVDNDHDAQPQQEPGTNDLVRA
ncbi:cation:dicarboxylate symporter family transporter [Nocardia brasiliensis]|uniref:cation:dicarboxylate symporter family transporter n=1 Tax=Nocardia brasiliensis TaxID=37326 RepID=UPI0005A7861E|nr:cation:dicarboxylase symporter family transporter [Nocardia brasiliensis]AVL26613.1 C4-dicarboxylate transporter DctA [Nocardia brasiliensis]SUB09183.1 Aerobic C4-dicarboxylate transport protein [Nocardia brasiliensis]